MNARQSSRTALQKKTRRRSFIETIWDALSGKSGGSRREKQRGMQFESLEDRKVLTTYFFENNSAISIPNSGSATPYPSTISVAGTSGNITGVTASINNFSHGFLDDVAILLQSPTTNTELLRNAGGGSTVANVTYTFADGNSLIPDNGLAGTGTYAPSLYSTVTYPASAPTPIGTTMAALNGASANGNWNLFVFDDGAGDSGSIADGWSLAVTTNTGTDLTYNMASNPGAIEIELRVSGGNYEIINSQNSAVLARQGVAATTSITITGTNAADLLTVNYASGAITAAVNFNGGAPATSPGDELVIIGTAGQVQTITKNYTGSDSGNIALSGGSLGTLGLVSYSGLEPVLINVGTVANVILNLPAGTENPDVVLGDDTNANFPGLGGNVAGMSAIDGSTFEFTAFTNPTNSLTINTGAAADTVNVQGLDAGFAANLTINGDALDTINFQTNPTNLAGGTLTADALVINVNQPVSTTGAGNIDLDGARNVNVNNPGSLSVVNGNITVDANPGGAVAGMGIGVMVTGAVTATGAGNISLTGHGGSGVTGSGGLNLDGATAIVSASGGNISLTGVGGPNGAILSFGVNMQVGAQVTNTGSGGISINGTGANPLVGFSWGVLVQPGTISVQDGPLSIMGTGTSGAVSGVGFVGSTVSATGTGTISVNGNGAMQSLNIINTQVNSGSGFVTLQGSNNVVFQGTTALNSTSGLVTITGDTGPGNTGGTITMTDGTTINAGSGNVVASTDGNILLSSIVTTSNSSPAISVQSTSGAISDNTAADTPNLQTGASGGIVLRASTGISDAAVDASDIDIATLSLAATTATGSISIQDDGNLDITTVDGLSGVTITNAAATGTLLLRDGTTGGNEFLQILQPVVNSGSGNVTVFANGTSFFDELRIQANVTASGGNILLVGFGDLEFLNTPTISTIGAGTIGLNAGATLTHPATVNITGGDDTSEINQNLQEFNVVSSGGDVTLNAQFNVRLSMVNAGSGRAFINANTFGDAFGAISDAHAGDGAGFANIIASAAVLVAAQGIGTNADPLDTQISQVDVSNSTSGVIQIRNVGALTTTQLGGPNANSVSGVAGGGEIRASSPLTLTGVNSTTGGMTYTAADDGNDADDILTIAAGATVTDNTALTLNGGDAVTFAATAIVTAPVIFINVDIAPNPGDDDAAGGVVTLTAPTNLVGLTFMTGGDDADTFNIIPQTNVASQIFLFGNDPTAAPGDTLNYTGAATKTITGVGQGTLTAPGVAQVDFFQIETVAGGPFTDVVNISSLPNSGDGLRNHLRVVRNGVNIEFYYDSDGPGAAPEVLLLQQLYANTVSPITVTGSNNDADTLIVDHTGGFINRVFNYDGQGPANVGEPGGDALEFRGGTVNNETYAVGTTEDRGTWVQDPDGTPAQRGSLTPGADGMVVNFVGLEPIDSSTVATFFDVVYDAADADQLSIVNGGLLNGFTSLQVNDLSNTFETFRFANKTTVSLHLNGGADTATLNYTTPAAGLTTLEVYGNGLGTVAGVQADDGGNDTFVALATALGVTNNILGQDGNDVLRHLVADGANLQNILGTINYTGGAGAADYVSLQDSNDPTADLVTLTNTQLSGASPADINYLSTEFFLFESSSGNDTINVLSTNLGTTYLLLGDGGSDTFTIGNQTADFGVVFDGSLDAIQGPITISGDFINIPGASVDTLNVDDSGTASLFAVASISNIGNTTFTNFTGSTFTAPTTQLLGFAPAAINYFHANYSAGSFIGTVTNLESLNVLASTGSDTINVNATTAVTATVIDAREGNDTVTIAGDALSANNTFLGFDGVDEFTLNVAANLGQTAFAPIQSVLIDGQLAAMTSTARDRLTINDNNALFARDLNYDYTDTAGGLNIAPTSAGNGLAGGVNMNLALQTLGLETVIFNAPGGNNDAVRVTGTSGDDVIAVGLLASTTSATVFLNGAPYLGTPPETIANSRPGVSGGGNGPDILINGITALSGIQLFGDGNTNTVGMGDRAVVYASSEAGLNTGNGEDIFQPNGFAAGELIPGFGVNNAFDTIGVNGFFFGTTATPVGATDVRVFNGGVTELMPVFVNDASFLQVGAPAPQQQAAIIVNAGDEPSFGLPGIIADNIFVNVSTNFNIRVNGNLPPLQVGPNGLPIGDQLNIFGPGDVNIFSDKAAPPNVTVTFSLNPTPFGVQYSSIERLLLTPSTGVVNLIGDNNDPNVDQNDNFVVVGRDIDAGNPFPPNDDGVNEMTVVINGSAPILLDGVRFLNVFGDDQNPPPGTPSMGNDIDTLEITPYADDTPRGWGIDVAFNEGNPPGMDGEQADLLIVHTSLFGGMVSENIVIKSSGPDNGEVVITNASFGTPIVDIDFVFNTDIIVLDDDGFLNDTDTLTLQGTSPSTVQASGNDQFDINANAAQTAADPFVTVTDIDSGLILYQLRGFVPSQGLQIPAPILTLNFEGLEGDDTFNLVGPGAVLAPFFVNGQANFLGGAGDDDLNIDLANGQMFGGTGIVFDGGTGADFLTLTNTAALVAPITTTTYTPGPVVGDGQLVYVDGVNPNMVVDFVSLSPVLDTIVSGNLIINANDASNAINYQPGVIDAVNNGLVSIDNHETIEFANKTVLTINALAGDDVINLNNPNTPTGLGMGLMAGVPAIIVNGGDPTASDQVIVNGTAGVDNVTIATLTNNSALVTGAGPVVIAVNTTEGLTYEGQGGGDALTYQTPATLDSIIFTPGATADAGGITTSVFGGGGPLLGLQYANLGALGTLTFTDAGAPAAGIDSLEIRGTANADTFNLGAAPGSVTILDAQLLESRTVTISTPGIGALSLHGLDGDDVFNVPGNHGYQFGVGVQGGNPSSGSDVLNFGGTGGAVVADYGLATITEGANGPVFFTGVEIINANTAGGNLTINDTLSNDVFDVTPTGVNAVTTRLTSATPVVTNTPVINGTTIGTFLVNAIFGDDTLKVRYSSNGETIAVDGAAGTVNVTTPAATFEQVTFTNGANGLDALEVYGNQGSDTFNVTPSATATIFIDGGDPIGIVGDTIVINGGVTLFKPGPEVDEGGFQVGANELISFDHIEAAVVMGAPCAIVTGTNGDDDITVIARDASTHAGTDGVQDFTVSVNAGLEVLYIGTAMLGIDALAGDDDIVIRAPAPNDAAWNVQVSVVGGSPSAGDPAEGDRLVLETPLADVITYTPTGSDTATIGINAGNTGGLISILSALPAGFCPGIVYTSSVGGVEVVQYDGEGGTDTFNFVGTGGNDTITHTPGAGIDEGSLRLGTLLGVSYQNLGAAGLVRVDGGAGADTLIAQGTAGSDNFTINSVSALIGQILVNGRIPLQTTNGTATANTVETYQIDSLEGDDNVTINYPLAANITTVAVNAGGPGGSDVLTINGDAATVEAFVVTPGSTKGVGNVAVNAVNTPYTGIEHVFIAANAPAQADTLTINDGLPVIGGGNNVWTVTSGTVGDLVQIDNRETIDYSSFSTVVLNDIFGSDTFNVHIVRTSGFSTSLTVNPERDDDIVNLFGTEANDTVTSTANAISIGTAQTTARTLTIGAAAPNIFAQVNLYTLGGADNIDLDLGLAGTRKLVDAGSENDTINMLGTLDATIFGGTGDDNIVGTPLADLIFGGSGNDILLGAGGIDAIYGEDGNDIFGNPSLVANSVADDAGNDALFGGAGSDTFVWEPGDGSDIIEGGADESDVMLFFGNAAANAFILSAVATRLELNFGAGAVLMSAAGVEEVDVRGLAGADTFTVNDLFPTDVRTVTLDLAVEAGVADTVTVAGRNVSDNVNIAQTTATRVSVTGLRYDVRIDNAIAADNDILNVNGNDGNDTIVAQDALTTAYAAANLRVNGGNGDDFISGHGTLSGDAGNDTLVGGAAGQTINGGTGNDQIFGGDGDDSLFGNAGEDTFVGGLGNDTIDGGGDWDTILVSATSANDRIDVRQNQVVAGISQLLYEISNQFTPGVDGLVGGAGTETDSLVANAGSAVEEVRVVAGSGDDQIRATHNDLLISLGQQAFSVRMTIDGGAPGASDRLTVQDDGIGDTTIQRIGGAVGSGSFQIGALAPVVYLDVEYASLNPVNAITGATGSDSNGRLIVFPFDPREQNQTLTNATFLGNGTANLTGTIDPGVDAAPGFGIAGDEDWFRVVAPVSGVLDFQVYFNELAQLANTRAGLPGNGNLDIGVYDADGLVNGNPLAIGGFGTFGANDGGAELDTAPLANERVRIPAVAGQTYYIRIGGAAMLQNGTPNTSPAVNVYNLSVVSTAAPVSRDLELDDVIAQSTVLAAPAPTATSFTAPAAGLSATAGFYVGKFVYFTSGPLNGQRGVVTAYNGAGAFTFAAGTFTGAPAAGDAFQVESVDSGRSQLDNVTRDNTPTIFLRLDDAFLLNDIPGNPAGQTNAPPPDQIIPITYQINGSLPATPANQGAGGFNPGFRIAIFDETDTHNPVNLGYATPVAGAPGVYTFTFTTALSDGSHFITAKVEMIDPADTTAAAGIVRATGFGAASQSLEIVVDTAQPPVSFGQPSSTQAGREFTLNDGLHPDSDSGVLGMPASFNDNITNVLTPKVFGTAEANSIVRVYIDNLNTTTYPGTVVGAFDVFDVLGAQTVASPLDGTNQLPTGRWDTELTVSLNDQRFFPNKDGVRTLFVTAEDASGNVRPVDPLQIERLNLFVDTQGPQVTDVRFNSVTSTYNVFDHKNEGLPQGPGEPGTLVPTPVVNSIIVKLQDLPARAVNFFYQAIKTNANLVNQANGAILNGGVADLPLGLVTLTGDAEGIIPISRVTFTADQNPNTVPIDGFGGVADIARGYLTITFGSDPDGVPGNADDIARSLPDDRFTLTVSDSLQDPVGNKLDGETQTDEPHDQPRFPSGDGIPGADFVSRFTVDSRPEVGTWAAGSVYIDINGNELWDPTNPDFTNRDIAFMYAYTADDVFAGNFSLNPGSTADGFDKLGAYGRVNGQFRWLIDTDNDGVPNLRVNDPANFNGLPTAGDFDGNAANGDEVAVFNGTTWMLDTNHDYRLDTVVNWPAPAGGYPVVGDFDGDNIDDLGAWNDDFFRIDLGNNGYGQIDVLPFRFGFIGVGDRPVAADMNQDGIDDLGLWVPARGGVLPQESGEFFFLVSGAVPNDDANGPAVLGPSVINRIVIDSITGERVVRFQPVPFGNDLQIQFGDEFALPIVGNFDPPPVTANTPLIEGTNPRDALDVNNDGFITGLDALIIVDRLNTGGPGLLEIAEFPSAPFYDVNGDGYVTGLDALIIADYLNIHLLNGEGEDDDSGSALDDGEGESLDDLIGLLASGDDR